MSEAASNTMQGVGLKRSRSNKSSTASRCPKRRETVAGYSGEYTADELNALERAAVILGTSLPDLIANTRPRTDTATTDTSTFELLSSTSSPDSFPSKEMVPFNLKLPDFTKRASESFNPSALHFGQDGASNDISSEYSVVPWLSSTDLEQGDGLNDYGEIQEQPSYNDWELNLFNNPDIWGDLGFEDVTLGTTSAPILPRSTCYDEVATSQTPAEDLSMLNPNNIAFLAQPTIPRADSNGTQSNEHNVNSISGLTTETKETPNPPTKKNQKPQNKLTKSKRRGPFQDMQERQQTGLTRKAKACLRCRMQRIRCRPDPLNPNGNCLTCRNVIGPTLSRLPCLRYIISDAQLIDHDVRPRAAWSQRWKKMEIVDIKKWRSSEIKVIHITQDVGGAFYKLKVREFEPVDGDALERKWVTNGEPQSFKCTPYAIANMKKAGQTLVKFADEHLGAAICHYIDETDSLLRDTYSMTYRYSLFAEKDDERRLLKSVLRLWCASRMESCSDRICSAETLGMEAQNYGKACPNSGNILVPPVLNAQMEVIVTVMILQPMKKAVLQGLQKLVESNRPGSWFSIYLCLFVLLHSCALLTAADNKRAKKYGGQDRFFRRQLIESLHNGAKILLGHFHYCNKGSHPFSMDWSLPEVMERAGFDAEQAAFMQKTTEQVRKKAQRFQEIRENGIFEDEYYFLAQLYDRDWKPVHTI